MSRVIIGVLVLCVLSFFALGQAEEAIEMPGWVFFEGSWRYQISEGFDYVFTIVQVPSYYRCTELQVEWIRTDPDPRIVSIDYGGTTGLSLFADEFGEAALGIAMWFASGDADISGYGIFRRILPDGLGDRISLTLYLYSESSKSCLVNDNTQTTFILIRDVKKGPLIQDVKEGAEEP